MRRDALGRLVSGGANLNPGGRPKGIAAEARELLERIDWRQRLEDLLNDERTFPSLTVQVIQLLLDRGHGKATQVTVNAEASVGAVADAVDLPVVSAAAALEALEVAKRLRAETQQKPAFATVEGVLLAQQAEPAQEGK